MNKKRKDKFTTAKPSPNDYKYARNVLKGIPLSRSMSADALENVVAYFKKYCIMKLREEEWKKETSKWLATAPWMANRCNDYYIPYIELLIEKGILEYDEDKKIVFLKEDGNHDEHINIEEIDEPFEDIRAYIMDDINHNRKIKLKMAVFHARSFIDFMDRTGYAIVEILKANPNFTMEVLCVGKYSGKIAQESANKEELKVAIADGLLSLYELAEKYKKQFKIRIVTKDIIFASLRANILIVDNEIEICHLMNFRFGYERGCCGKSYNIDPESSLAIETEDLFNRAFSRAVPAKRNGEWIKYLCKKICRVVLPGLVFFFVSYVFSDWIIGKIQSNDQVESLLLTFLTAGFTALCSTVADMIKNCIKYRYYE